MLFVSLNLAFTFSVLTLIAALLAGVARMVALMLVDLNPSHRSATIANMVDMMMQACFRSVLTAAVVSWVTAILVRVIGGDINAL